MAKLPAHVGILMALAHRECAEVYEADLDAAESETMILNIWKGTFGMLESRSVYEAMLRYADHLDDDFGPSRDPDG